jgi:hypothetical protein
MMKGAQYGQLCRIDSLGHVSGGHLATVSERENLAQRLLTPAAGCGDGIASNAIVGDGEIFRSRMHMFMTGACAKDMDAGEGCSVVRDRVAVLE